MANLVPRQSSGQQPLGVVPMAMALVVAAFLGAALGLVIESGGTEEGAPRQPGQAAEGEAPSD